MILRNEVTKSARLPFLVIVTRLPVYYGNLVRKTKPLVLCLETIQSKPISVTGSLHMRIDSSIHTTVLPVTTQLLNFLPGLQVIMRMCNDPETGASACLEDGHDSSPEQNRQIVNWL